jgi:hypothetical protein
MFWHVDRTPSKLFMTEPRDAVLGLKISGPSFVPFGNISHVHAHATNHVEAETICRKLAYKQVIHNK